MAEPAAGAAPLEIPVIEHRILESQSASSQDEKPAIAAGDGNGEPAIVNVHPADVQDDLDSEPEKASLANFWVGISASLRVS